MASRSSPLPCSVLEWGLWMVSAPHPQAAPGSEAPSSSAVGGVGWPPPPPPCKGLAYQVCDWDHPLPPAPPRPEGGSSPAALVGRGGAKASSSHAKTLNFKLF